MGFAGSGREEEGIERRAERESGFVIKPVNSNLG